MLGSISSRENESGVGSVGTGDAGSGMAGIVAAVIGNALEWFDMIAYGFFAPVIAKLFFPTKDPAAGLILALGTFALSFLARPIGALLIGPFADRAGRRSAMVAVSLLMMLGSAMIAAMPTYARIGAWAPALLLLARLIQGFSAGGEFGSATAFLAEQSSARRAFYASWQFAGQGLAMVLAAGLGLLVLHMLPPPALTAWGWRLPFTFGVLVGPVAFVLRRYAHETPAFLAAHPRGHEVGERLPSGEFARRILVGVGAVLVATVGMYFMIYLPTFAKTTLHLDESAGYLSTFLAGIVLSLAPPIGGMLADRHGKAAVALPAAVALAAMPGPLFAWLVREPGLVSLLAVQGCLSLGCAAYLGALPALLAGLYPVTQRTTGLSLAYNIAVVSAGGVAPMIFATLVHVTGLAWIPSLYLTLAALLSLVAVAWAKRMNWTD